MTNKILTALLCLAAIAAQAEETNDTTVIYKGKRIVIGERGGEPDFKVFDRKDNYLTKTKESVFTDGTEEERVFSGMAMTGIKDLDKRKFDPGMPTVWYGFGSMVTKPLGSSYDGTRAHRTGSLEIGLTPYSVAFAMNKSKTIGISAGVQLVYSRYSFDKNHAMSHEGDIVKRTDNPATTENNIHFGSLRLPVMFRIQSIDDIYSCNIGLSFEARTNAKYNFKSTDATDGVTDYLRLNRFGMNMELDMQFGVLNIGTTIGLTPLFKTTDGIKPSVCTVKVGVDLLKTYRLAAKRKAKGN